MLHLPNKIKGLLRTSLSSESLIVKYYQTRKPAHLTALVARYNETIYHYLLTLTQPEIAEDILQSVWLKVIHATPTYPEQIIVKSWLFKIARNSLIDELRKNKKWQFEQLDEQKLITHAIEMTSMCEDKLSMFDQALSQLPILQKESFVFQQEGLSLIEISEITGDGVETIKSRLRYAKTNLRKLMSNS